MRSGDHERIVALLLDGVVDLGLVTWPCTEAVAADLQAILVFHEPVVLVASPGHALAGRGAVSEEALVSLGRPLIRLRWSQAHHPAILRLAERAGPLVDLTMEAARRLALEGAGVGYFARTYVAEDLDRGTLVALEVAGQARLHRDSALVRRRRAGPLSPAAAALIEAIRRQAMALGLLGGAAGSARGATARRRSRRR